MDSGPYEVVLPNVVVISIGSPITFIFDSLKDIGFGISQKQHFEFVYSGLIKKFSNRESSSISISYQSSNNKSADIGLIPKQLIKICLAGFPNN